MARGLRLFGHPIHPMISDFPIALLGSSLLWDALGVFQGSPVWWQISFWDIALGLATSVLAAAVGMIDYAAIPESKPRAVSKGTRHMIFMLSAVTAYILALSIRRGDTPPTGWALYGTIACEALGLALLGIGGWYGGELVFEEGIGVDHEP